MKNEKFSSQLSTQDKWNLGAKRHSDWWGQLERRKGNIQGWLKLDEGDPGVQLVFL
jgi:hypothetical protein